MERCTKLRGECHDPRCYTDTPHECHDMACRTGPLTKRVTDAQATIAALQARVKELEEWKHIVTGAGTDQESVIRLAAYEYTKIAVQCWKEANAKLESQLTQRTAELEAVREQLRLANIDQANAEAKVNDLQAELERVREELVEERAMMLLTNEVLIPSLTHRQGMEG